jgi:hypothetical protein
LNVFDVMWCEVRTCSFFFDVCTLCKFIPLSPKTIGCWWILHQWQILFLDKDQHCLCFVCSWLQSQMRENNSEWHISYFETIEWRLLVNWSVLSQSVLFLQIKDFQIVLDQNVKKTVRSCYWFDFTTLLFPNFYWHEKPSLKGNC